MFKENALLKLAYLSTNRTGLNFRKLINTSNWDVVKIRFFHKITIFPFTLSLYEILKQKDP